MTSRIQQHRLYSLLSLVIIYTSSTLLLVCVVNGEKDSNPYPWGENPNNRFKMYWNDARNVLQDLNQFQALYVKYHGCVWSECSIDNYNDDGEDRDGDEYWYQYRTQPFCANAAYSLYGVLKNHISFTPWNACTRGTYINSFFTYGGADTIMEALNIHAQTVFDDENGYYYSNNNNDDDGYRSTHANAVCYAADGENNNNDNNNKNDNNNDDNYGISSTMGCTKDGKFVAANFQGQTCDGNYFLEEFDDLSKYNRALNHVNCRAIYKKRWKSSNSKTSNNRYLLENGDEYNNYEEFPDEMTEEEYQEYKRLLEEGEDNEDEEVNDDGNNNNSAYTYDSAAELLLVNSWACDISLYPNGECPDPYGLKRKYDTILHSVSKGRSVRYVITTQRFRPFILFIASIATCIALLSYIGAYYINRKDVMKQKGTIKTIANDTIYAIRIICTVCYEKIVKLCTLCNDLLSGEIRRRRKMKKLKKKLIKQKNKKKLKSSSSKKSSRRGRRRSRDEDDDDDGNYNRMDEDNDDDDNAQQQQPVTTPHVDTMNTDDVSLDDDEYDYYKNMKSLPTSQDDDDDNTDNDDNNTDNEFNSNTEQQIIPTIARSSSASIRSLRRKMKQKKSMKQQQKQQHRSSRRQQQQQQKYKADAAAAAAEQTGSFNDDQYYDNDEYIPSSTSGLV